MVLSLEELGITDYADLVFCNHKRKTLRKAQGMTQEKMAEVLNISLEHLSKMGRGKRNPSIDLIIAMACYFHVSTDYLLMGKDWVTRFLTQQTNYIIFELDRRS